MSIALDLGSHSIRSLRPVGRQLHARNCRSVYSILPDNTEQRRLLEKAKIAYAACDDNLILLGEAAEELSRLFQTPCIDLLPGGTVPQSDPVARQIIALFIDALLPAPTMERQICCFTQSGHARAQTSFESRTGFVAHLIQLRGYVPRPLGAGMALIFAELVQEKFTGIGLALGAAGAEISIAHCGHEIASCSVPRGRVWADELATLIATEPRVGRLTQRLSIVCGGGTARTPGFCGLLRQQLYQHRLPVELGDIRLASDSPYTIARGCLINAQLEAADTQPLRRAA